MSVSLMLSDRALTIEDDVLGFALFGQRLEVVGCSQRPRFVIIIKCHGA